MGSNPDHKSMFARTSPPSKPRYHVRLPMDDAYRRWQESSEALRDAVIRQANALDYLALEWPSHHGEPPMGLDLARLSMAEGMIEAHAWWEEDGGD